MLACAVRYARQNAHRYRGERHHLVLVGHSMGRYVGAIVALGGRHLPLGQGTCLSTLGMKASLPEGFVSVAGVAEIRRDYRIDQVFFDGTCAKSPSVCVERRCSTHVGRHVGRNHRLKVGIIFERHDPFMSIRHPTHLHQALTQAGYDADLILLSEGTTHFDILDTTGGSGGASSRSCGTSCVRPTATDA